MNRVAVRWLRGGAWVLAWAITSGCVLWALGALLYDWPTLKPAAVCGFGVLLVAALALLRGQTFKIVAVFGVFLLVLGWWWTLKPSNTRPWQGDVAQAAWGEIAGDKVTLHNVRNCEYRTETDYTPRWETRTVQLSHLSSVDLAITYWGSALMAHPIVSFQFDDAPAVCFSIETRKEVGESYSAIGGFYRQYELIYVCADERDVVRLRTNYRAGEDVYLYRTMLPAEKARRWFLEYLAAMNELRLKPRWYNAATTNCTTTIRTQHAAAERAPWDWRMLVNGYADEMLYERGALAGGIPFAELKRQARINEAAVASDGAADFSQRIRTGRSGFASLLRVGMEEPGLKLEGAPPG